MLRIWQTVTSWLRPKPANLRPAKPETSEVAAARLIDRYSTYPSRGLTPAKLADILTGAGDYGSLRARAELFEEMEEKDAQLASLLQTRKLAVAGLEWDVIDSGNEKITEFVRDNLNRLDISRIILDLMDAVGKGYSALEIIWQVKGGQVTVQELQWIHPKRISYVMSLIPRIITDEEQSLGIEPPPWKIVFHRYRARSGHDTRAGVLQIVAWMYLFKNLCLKSWVSFIETYGKPLRLGKYDVTATEADKEALLKAVTQLGTDAAGVISKNTEIEFVDAIKGPGRANPFEDLVNLCNREMAKAILGQTLSSDPTQATGTYAAAKVHEMVRQDILEADSEAVADTISKQLIYPLVGFNFGWDMADKYAPRFTLLHEAEEDLEKLAKVYKALIESGVPIPRDHIYERFGIPAPEEGQAVVGMAPAPASAEAHKAAYTGIVPDITDGQVIRVQQQLDRLVEEAVAASADAMSRMLAPVRDRIAQAKSMEEIRDALIEAYPEMPIEDMAETIYQARMLAYMVGRLYGPAAG